MIREFIQKYFSSDKSLDYNPWTSTKDNWNYSFFNKPLTPQEIEIFSNADIGNDSQIKKQLLSFKETELTDKLLNTVWSASA